MIKIRGMRPLKMVGIGAAALVAFAVALVVFGWVTLHLWNWLMPAIFGLRTITFVQALGLLLLSHILFGGFHGRGRGRRNWRGHMDERCAHMTPEERERFRAGMRGRGGCGFGPDREPAPEQKPL
jgi:hypothetical protein